MTDPREQIINGLKFLMLPVKGGTFRMGREPDDMEANSLEEPGHDVVVSDFYLGQFPVTQDFWLEIMAKNPSFFLGERRPVETVSWDDTKDFIQQLNAITEGKRPKGYRYRLPTEAEWEYAARGGNISGGYKYSGSDKLNEVGWFSGNSHSETKPVGMIAPNELGLYDMSGNVWEWCEDWYSPTYYKECITKGVVENPRGPKKSTHRVNRGGGWYGPASGCNSSTRYSWQPSFRDFDLGFRLALALQ